MTVVLWLADLSDRRAWGPVRMTAAAWAMALVEAASVLAGELRPWRQRSA